MIDTIERRDADRLWVLGAPDPEMEAIEALLRECGERVIHATSPSGERIRPGQQAAPVHIGDATTVYTVECDPPLACGEPEDEPDMGQVILNGSRYMAARCCVGISVIRIDHHCPGDPGYGRPPSEFLAASSIGQVIAELALAHALRLDWEPCYHRQPYGWQSQAPQFEPYYGYGHTRGRLGWVGSPARWAVGYPAAHTDAVFVPAELVLVAAADHCLAAAYRGECPGVDPDALMRWRAETRAAFQGRSVEDVLADIEEAIEEIRYAPTLRGVSIVEHRRVVKAWEYDRVCNGLRPDPDTWYRRRAEALDAVDVPSDLEDVLDLRDYEVPELPEAAAREGVAYLATVQDRDGRRKVVLGGHTTPEMVRAFMDTWAPAQGLVDAYGDPARGFAGAYLTAEAPAL